MSVFERQRCTTFFKTYNFSCTFWGIKNHTKNTTFGVLTTNYIMDYNDL
ncbi:MAG: hypothetical protein JSV88_24810 [Candidatus Aminicenantes bacterium]|nr:MAG: hypothetical protein JSV88_24810 [Candidatus Aminicenantes bacterium]